MYCSKCGTQNADTNQFCGSCGSPLGGAAPKVIVKTEDTALGGLIPYRNKSALIAYYLGIFSLVCGILLGLPALILGIKGLGYAKLHPEVKGKTHAWVGIVLGGITSAISIVLLVFYLVYATRGR
jgi:hypothetical protein